jgi:iron complex transport system ATP-binding protein
MTESLLSAGGLAFRYRTAEKPLFTDVSLVLARGEALSILGPNGVGKTTLLACLTGARRPDAGWVRCGAELIGDMSTRNIARRIAVVHQLHDSTFAYSVETIVLLGRAAHIGVFGRPSERDRAIAYRAMQRVGIGHLASRSFGELSGGERQLAVIARALAQEAPTLALDEPTSHLDLANQARVLMLLRDLMADGHSILTTSHFPEHALLLGGKALLLFGTGAPVAGPVGDVVTELNLESAYQVPVALLRSKEAIACAPRLQ